MLDFHDSPTFFNMCFFSRSPIPLCFPRCLFFRNNIFVLKVLKSDANINCAAVAAKCLTGMAKGLRNKFGPHTASLSPIIFDKFKEKKPHLRDPLIELIDAVFATTVII